MQEIYLLEIREKGSTGTIEGAYWSLGAAQSDARRRARNHYLKACEGRSAQSMTNDAPITLAADPSPIVHLSQVVEDWGNDALSVRGRTTFYCVRKVRVLEAPLEALAGQAE